MDMGLGELQELVMDKEAWRACSSWGRKESDMTEWLNWTEMPFHTEFRWYFFYLHPYFLTSSAVTADIINAENWNSPL